MQGVGQGSNPCLGARNTPLVRITVQLHDDMRYACPFPNGTGVPSMRLQQHLVQQ